MPQGSRLTMLAVSLGVAATALLLSGCSVAPVAPSSPPASDSDRARPTASAAPAPSTVAPPAGSQQSSRDLTPFVPAVGDCLDASKEHGLSASSVVSCAEPHDDEVYGELTIDGGEFPGDGTIAAIGDAGCTTRFEDFIGISHADSALDFYTLVPTSESWSAGHRTVSCIVWNPTDHVIGSLEGAAY
jgi:hypothetical protein